MQLVCGFGGTEVGYVWVSGIPDLETIRARPLQQCLTAGVCREHAPIVSHTFELPRRGKSLDSNNTMKRALTLASVFTVAGSLLAADASLKDQVVEAAQKLAQEDNYSWHTQTDVPEGAQFRPGPIDGQSEKGGYTHISWSIFDNAVEIVQKGKKAAYKDQYGAWQLADENASDGPDGWMSMFALNMPNPAKQAAEIAGDVVELKQEGDALTGELTEAGAKALMSFRRGGDGPTISGAKGSAKFWLKDGALQKYQYKVKGLMDWNGNEVDIDRDTTVEIKGVGSTKVEVVEEAKTKLES